MVVVIIEIVCVIERNLKKVSQRSLMFLPQITWKRQVCTMAAITECQVSKQPIKAIEAVSIMELLAQVWQWRQVHLIVCLSLHAI